MESITLGEQKREKVPRISGEEALILLGLAKTRITTKTNTVNIYRISPNFKYSMLNYHLGSVTNQHMLITILKSGFRQVHQKLIIVHQLILLMNPHSKWDV